jgi:hypothetical protein
MGRHAEHQVHENSATAWRMLDRSKREALVLSAYRMASEPLTDRAVAERLGFDDMNMVRPTCTRLFQANDLVERDRVVDPITRRPVRTMTIAQPVQADLREIL